MNIIICILPLIINYMVIKKITSPQFSHLKIQAKVPNVYFIFFKKRKLVRKTDKKPTNLSDFGMIEFK